ncbi:caspase domain-containing protein [Flammula alnicola]|nr:caspase domain-containing protein [Flammula alnicola]
MAYPLPFCLQQSAPLFQDLFAHLIEILNHPGRSKRKALLIGVQEVRGCERSSTLENVVMITAGDGTATFAPRGKLKGKRKGKKKQASGFLRLKGPHRDVKAMRDLLIDVYKYDPTDVMLLIDDDDPDQVQPTRENILSEINKLVKDAREGDKFFFHFSGHAKQEDTTDIDEEDGKNEFILTSDGQKIMDNVLRAGLVDPLPVGSSLNVRKDRQLLSLIVAIRDPYSIFFTTAATEFTYRGSTRAGEELTPAGHEMIGSWKTPTQTTAMSPLALREANGKDNDLQPTLSSVTVSSRARTLPLSINTTVRKGSLKIFSPTTTQCMSPESIFCTGRCREDYYFQGNVKPTAEVVCLSSSKDSQITWEDSEGNSMTQHLIRLLTKEPNPTLHDLLTVVSHEIHAFYVDLHERARMYKKKINDVNRRKEDLGEIPLPVELVEMHNFQDPQLSTHNPIMHHRMPNVLACTFVWTLHYSFHIAQRSISAWSSSDILASETRWQNAATTPPSPHPLYDVETARDIGKTGGARLSLPIIHYPDYPSPRFPILPHSRYVHLWRSLYRGQDFNDWLPFGHNENAPHGPLKLTRGAIWGRKKALLIGVQRVREAELEDSLVEGGMVITPLPRGRRKKKAKVAKDVEEGAPDLGVLKGPHHDVKIMRDLLLDKYGYYPEDIIVLIDDDDPNHTQPTRSNIMFHINRLVAGSRKRDKLFFHFCGHADQEDTDEIDEEDGKNESAARRFWTAAIQAHCSVFAINIMWQPRYSSGPHIDLPHYRCNRVYVPWLNKGRRRTNTLWAIRCKEGGIYMGSSDPNNSADADSSNIVKTAIRNNMAQSGVLLPPSDSISRSITPNGRSSLAITTQQPMHNGNVVPDADVVCLSAAKDSQMAWEDVEGNSMTQYLVKNLKGVAANPHPTLHNLLTLVSHDIHSYYVKDLHQKAHQFRKEVQVFNRRRKVPVEVPPYEMHNFQNPELSSQAPLDMDRIFDL